MKKIIYILTAATLISCTKNEVAYEQTNEIGFTAVAGNITKAVVDGTTYPTDLNMYVFAWTTDYAPTATQNSPNYINKGEFQHKTVDGISKAVWGGYPNPYYWPNTKKLHFAGCSLSGNLDKPQTQVVEGPTPEYNCYTDAMTITGYSPLYGTKDGENDLMWFTSAEYNDTAANGYDKDTDYVPVKMYHTCSWITFIVKGETATQSYKVTEMEMINIDQTATVTCDPSPENSDPTIKWTGNTDKENNENNPTDYEITLWKAQDAEKAEITIGTTGVNVETNDATTTKNTGGNIVVIPQVPGKLCLKYTYESSTGTTITEVVDGNDALDLKISDVVADNVWEPGKHYIYTLTIKANEILIAPTPNPWGDPTNGNITVE